MKRSQVLSGTETSSGVGGVEVRARLREMAQATDELLHALEASGLRQGSHQSPQYSLNVLDRRLPKRDVYDLLLACETLATVTGPTLLASDTVQEVRMRAYSLLQTVRLIARITGTHVPAGESGATPRLNGLLLHSAFASPVAQDALAHLVEHLTEVASGDGEQIAATRFEVRIGTRFLVPGSVIALTLALIIFFLSGVAFASGAITLSPHGIDFSTLQNIMATQTAAASNSDVSATATANAQRSTPSGQSATPTLMPNGYPTATSSGRKSTPTPTSTAPSASTLATSPASIQLCFGTDTRFTVSYTGSSSAITWHASSPDAANIALSLDGTNFTNSVSGALQPGASLAVYVRLLNDVPIPPGNIAVTGSNGAKGSSVRYDTSGC